jgi:hypothetical protein
VVIAPPKVFMEALFPPEFDLAVTLLVITALLLLVTETVLVLLMLQTLVDKGPVVPLLQLLPAAIAGKTAAAKSAIEPAKVANFFIYLFTSFLYPPKLHAKAGLIFSRLFTPMESGSALCLGRKEQSCPA